MKTAMQEMIEYFELFQGADKSNQAMPLGISISIAKSLLEKEREQIKDAWLVRISNWDSEQEFNHYYLETYGGKDKL
jgi:hypothetical protein